MKNKSHLKFYQKITFKLLINIALLITVIEVILLIFSTFDRRNDLINIRREIYQNVAQKGIVSEEELLSNHAINLKVKAYPQRIIFMIILIILVVTGGMFFIVRNILMKPILMIYNANRALLEGSRAKSRISREVFPNNEIGMIMHSREEMLEKINTSIEQEKQLAAAQAARAVERKRAKELAEAYNDLKETRDMLIQAEKMSAVGRLASGIVHEVKNPLAVILLRIEYLSRLFRDHRQADKVFEEMKLAVRKADNVVKGLLDFAQVSRLDISTYSLNSLVHDSVLLLQGQMQAGKIELVLDLYKDALDVNVDREKIDRVFTNLLMNAAHAMPAGGTLRVKTYQKKLEGHDKHALHGEAGVFKPGEIVAIIEIEDTGCGIPKDALDKIFEPFFTTRRDKGGTGLGLSIVKNIVDMHGGAITIENKKESCGTKATVMLKIYSRNL